MGVFTVPEAGCLYDEAWGHSGVGHAELGAKMDRFADILYHNALVWALMNQRAILQHVHTATSYEVHFTVDLVSHVRTADRYLTVTDRGRLIIGGADVFVPISWQARECLAYSQQGGEKSWQLPPDWGEVTRVKLTPRYPVDSTAVIQEVAVVDGWVKLSLRPGQAVSVEAV